MSTTLYLVCLDHDPPLNSAAEVGNHLYDLDDAFSYIARREELVADLNDDDKMHAVYRCWPAWQLNAACFLDDHPKCRVAVRDEYGKFHYPQQEGEDGPTTQ